MLRAAGCIAALVLGVSAATFVAGAAEAQIAARSGQRAVPSREELNPAARVRPAARSGGLLDAPVNLPCPLADSNLSFKLDSVEITGSTLPRKATERAYSDLLGQTIPVGRICMIRDRLARILFRHSIMARVLVPEQTIAGGKLKLTVLEARIVSVRVRTTGEKSDIGPAQDRVEAYLEKLRGLTPLDLETAQRYLALANSVPGVRISSALRASPEGLGAVDLEVTVERDPVSFAAVVQNTGSESLGPWSALVRADLNGFTSYGERTSLIGYHTISGEQQILQVIEEARLGGEGLVGRGSFSYGLSHPGDILAPLKLKGTSIVATAEVSYPIVRLIRPYSLWTEAGFDFIDQKIVFGGGGDLSNDKLRVAFARVRGIYNQPFAGTPFRMYGDAVVEGRKGFSFLGGSKAGDVGLSRLQGDPSAYTVRADGRLHFEWSRWLDLGLEGQAQYATKPLLAYEEIAAGTLTIGLGYPPSVLSGDKGVMGRVRLAGPRLDLWRLSLRPFGFYDIARLSNFDAGSTTRTLHSEGGGAEAELPIRALPFGLGPLGIRASVAYAKPLDKPFESAPQKPPSRVLFTLTLTR
jgi:hemolysin activation/secretion protein